MRLFEIAFVIIAAVAAIYSVTWFTCMSWYKPKEFSNTLVGFVKDWMPAADWFRSYYSSNLLLWIARFTFVPIILIFVIVIYLVLR